MSSISYRDNVKTATMEMTQQGVGVSAAARKYVRQHAPEYAHVGNAELNEVIASDFLKREPWHRFRLTKTFQGIAEIRKSDSYYYIALVRGRGTDRAGYDIIVIQPTAKDPSEQVRKHRIRPGWGFEY